MLLLRTVLLTLSLMLSAAFAAGAQEQGALAFVADGIAFPRNLTAHDGRIFVLEQYAGRVVVIEDGKLRPEPFIDLGERIHPDASSDEGLLGIAFVPGAEPNHVYLSYIDRDRNLTLSRFSLEAGGGRADPASEEALFVLVREGLGSPCGHLEVDPADGSLYLCFGDDLADDAFNITVDEGSLAPQDPHAWPGKILRFDPASPGGPPEVVALGLHDPWHFTLDLVRDLMIVPDVGRFDWEEVNLLPLGEGDGEVAPNFGWPLAEGPECVDRCQDLDLITPTFAYGQSAARCGIVGGTVSRGGRRPAFQGAFLFADRCSGEVFALRNLDGAAEIRLIADTDLLPSAVGSGPAGDVLITDQADGALYRLRLPADGDANWRPARELMFQALAESLAQGTTRSQVDLQKVVTSRSWQVGRDLARVYRWLKAFWIF